MLGKIIVSLLGAALVLVGGWGVVKYGTSLFSNETSQKIKLWLDDQGKCRSSESTSVLNESSSLESAKESKPESLCAKLFANKLDGIDWSSVKIYWQDKEAKYEEAKAKWEQYKSKLVS